MIIITALMATIMESATCFMPEVTLGIIFRNSYKLGRTVKKQLWYVWFPQLIKMFGPNLEWAPQLV